MKKYGAKKDANHKEIFKIIEQKCCVMDLSHAGYGVPDGLAVVKGEIFLFEVKNPNTSYGRRGLNNNQKNWIKDWRGGPVYILRNDEDARNFSEGRFEKVEKEDSGWTAEHRE